jgi:hypothetical protein
MNRCLYLILGFKALIAFQIPVVCIALLNYEEVCSFEKKRASVRPATIYGRFSNKSSNVLSGFPPSRILWRFLGGKRFRNPARSNNVEIARWVLSRSKSVGFLFLFFSMLGCLLLLDLVMVVLSLSVGVFQRWFCLSLRGCLHHGP